MKRLKFENVSVRYHYDEFDALADLSFEVNEGETVSVMLGAQGGKTTAAKLIMGLLRPTCGKITADGAPLEETLPKARKIAYFCFPPLAFKTTVGKNVSRVLRLDGFGKLKAAKPRRPQTLRAGGACPQKSRLSRRGGLAETFSCARVGKESGVFYC
ncbi:MAG: ATP-binding cassette domain-containing protein [Lachnospiraceae bacterium]